MAELRMLWSDWLIWLLFFSGAAWLGFAFQKEHWRNSFKRVGRNKLAMLSLCVLCVYGAIGLLDSIHFQKIDDKGNESGSIYSLLDQVLEPLQLRKVEKTYSAPMATHSFMKENMVVEGRQVRDYPRLEHGGSHLEDDESVFWDFLQKAFLALVVSALLCFVITYAWYFLAGMLRKKNIEPANQGQPGFLDHVLILVKNQPAYPGLKARMVGQKTYLVFSYIVVFLFVFSVFLSLDYHLLGTDKTGNDVFYLAIKSIRTGLMIGTLTTLIVTPFAIIFGALAGYFGGWVDDIVQYIYTTLSSIPSILLIAAAMLILNAQYHESQESTTIIADKKLVFLCIILGVTSWTGLCRLIRGEVLKLKNVEYVQAADALGLSRIRIMLRHIVPNVMHIVLISMVLRFSGLVLVEAVLAYIGIGVDPSLQSWGNMINNARLELAREPVIWWNLIASFVFMVGLVLPANIFGDAVRDALDPRLRGKDAA